MEKKVGIKIIIWHIAAEMAKKQVRVRFSFMEIFLHNILFGENVISSFKKPSHSCVLESKAWRNKTETKNLKVKFIKTCDQYPRQFNFGHFFGSIIFPLLCWGKNNFSEHFFWLKWVIYFCLGKSFTWRHVQEWTDSLIWVIIVLFSVLNKINLKLSRSHGGIYRFEKKFKKDLLKRFTLQHLDLDFRFSEC